MDVIETLLAPTDFSKHGDAAVEYAAELAGRFEARLVILYVFDHPLIVGTYNTDLRVLGGVDPVCFATIGDVGAGRTEALADRYRAQGLRAEARVVEGSPAVEIVRTALAHDADMIVMGTRARRSLERWILGSVARAVVRTAFCPVLTVPTARETAQVHP